MGSILIKTVFCENSYKNVYAFIVYDIIQVCFEYNQVKYHKGNWT